MSFLSRHIGNINNGKNVYDMLCTVGVKTFDEMISKTGILKNFKSNSNILNYRLSEIDAQKTLKNMMDKNVNHKSYLGYGYYNVNTPSVIKKHIIENPQWYTAYTPYQAEISQGRLESQYNYQTIVKELTGLPIANASLLDEASASGEALNLSYGYYRKKRNKFIVDSKIHPHTLELLNTRAKTLGLDMIITELNGEGNKVISSNNPEDICNIIFQYPNTYGNIEIPNSILTYAKYNNILTTGITDLLALTQIITPKELGLNIALGNCQRFGIPMWYGGPHPAFFATSNNLLRYKPGRIIGETKDSNDDNAYRLSLQTREQHIKKENATSNICTSQSLLTNVVSFYSIYHGPEGLDRIAKNIKEKTDYFTKKYSDIHGCNDLINDHYFDTITLKVDNADKFCKSMKENYRNQLVRKITDTEIGITFDEITTNKQIDFLCECINVYKGNVENQSTIQPKYNIPDKYLRKIPYLTDDVFNKYHTETDIMRYMNSLVKKDYTLCDGMIPLGSCTMKLNAAYQLEPLTWNSVANVHPFVSPEYAEGYHELIKKVGNQLKEITGFNHISFQPNSGSTGEYAGLLCIKQYHKNNDSLDKNICLIPRSAHGTNFASATIANMKVETFDDTILKDLDTYQKYIDQFEGKVACLMITYPNTNGVFQNNIDKIVDITHMAGALVYMDGANMNALVGIFKPGYIGFDVCHLNLHKTFCIPHGGGGPGLGPILCNDKLAPYLPSNNIQDMDYNNNNNCGMVAASNWSSASLLTIPYLYMSCMGIKGLEKATKMAILNSNYMKVCLQDNYTITDINDEGFVGHEFIIDVTEFKELGITENDIAKRLIDYSFHPPTMSWPRSGVLMFEPTESESKEELDRLIEAMLSIRKEINMIKEGKYDKLNNPIKNAPHNMKMVIDWKFPYSIKEALYPVDGLMYNKFMPSVGRVNDIYGDKLLLSKSKN